MAIFALVATTRIHRLVRIAVSFESVLYSVVGRGAFGGLAFLCLFGLFEMNVRYNTLEVRHSARNVTRSGGVTVRVRPAASMLHVTRLLLRHVERPTDCSSILSIKQLVFYKLHCSFDRLHTIQSVFANGFRAWSERTDSRNAAVMRSDAFPSQSSIIGRLFCIIYVVHNCVV